MKRQTLGRIAVSSFLLLLISSASFAEVKLKIVVANPSSTEKQSTPIRYDLPKGIGPDQVIDIGVLEMKYDFDKNLYYLAGDVELAPAEKKVLQIELKDVWAIPEDNLMKLKNHTDLLTDKLKKTKHYNAGKTLAAAIDTKIDGIIKNGKTPGLSIKEKINRYYEDAVILGEVREKIGMLENLVLDVGGIVEERVQVPTTLAIPLDSDRLKTAKDSIELKITVRNPSEKTKQITPVKYLLPGEISPRHIIDLGGLEVAYDFNRERYYVYKENLELEPADSKDFTIKVADVWRVSEVELDALKKHTENVMVLLKDTEYYPGAVSVAGKVFADIDNIGKNQTAQVSAVEHIAYFRDNLETLARAKKEVSNLEKLVSQRGVSAGVTVKWPDEQGGGVEGRRKRGYEGFDMIAQSIFRGKAPTIATTWKIIFAIIAFMGIIAGLFFSLWYVQSKKRGGGKTE